MFCPECGARNADTARFCLKCGARLPVLPPPEQRRVAVPKAETRRWGRIMLGGLIALLLLVVVAGGIVVGVPRLSDWLAASREEPVESQTGLSKPSPILEPVAGVAITPTSTPLPPTPTLTSPPPTPTSTPLPPTATSTPLPPTPTATRLPPTPTLPPPIDPNFRADRTAIQAGDCSTLRWDVEGIAAVYLDGGGQIGHGSKVVCPTQTTNYTLEVVQRDGRRVPWPLRIEVRGEFTQHIFVIEYQGCVGGVSRSIGPVKGQVFDKSGRIIVGAVVTILVEGQSNIVPPGRTNEAGWYEWNLSPGQRVTFASLTVGGHRASFAPQNFEVRSQGGCFQHVNFRER